jgi:hypothetical protein
MIESCTEDPNPYEKPTIDIIPDELFVTIFEFLGNDTYDTIKFSYTCRRFHALSLKPEMWSSCAIYPHNLLFKYFDIKSPLYFRNNEKLDKLMVHDKYQYIEQRQYLKKKENAMQKRENRKKWVHTNIDIVVGITHSCLFAVLFAWTMLIMLAIIRRPYFTGDDDHILRAVFLPIHAAGVLSFIYVLIELVCMHITRINILPQITVFIIGVIFIWGAFLALQEKVLRTFNVYVRGSDNNIYWWQISFPITIAVTSMVPSFAWTWRRDLLLLSGYGSFFNRWARLSMLVIICLNCLFWPLFWDEFDFKFIKSIPNPVMVYLPLIPYALLFAFATKFTFTVRLAQVSNLITPCLHYSLACYGYLFIIL